MPAKPVSCVQCGKCFRPRLDVRAMVDGGEEWQYCCPNCGTWHTAGIVSPEGVQIRYQLQAVEEELLERPGERALLEQLVKLRHCLRAEVSRTSG